ncbi:MAG: serine/threonine protein kinase [Myxococcales bacterium]|nr:serine/threonine protein kinase [Myxococcales bacterium]
MPEVPHNQRDAPQRYGKFYLLRRLAEGGMAEIFLAKQIGPEGFERNVVIKRMLRALTSNAEFVTMFLDEARLAARLSHPNIVQIHELGLQDDCYFICMEYLPGEDFSAVMRALKRRRNELVPVHITARVMLEAAHGLQFAHDFADDSGQPLNVVHRDVSPSNVFCTYQGQVKLLDFGIARARNQASVTGAGTFRGKFLYMAPEQVLGAQIDRRTDVFTLGICLYEAVTGVRPFHRDNPEAILKAVAACDAPPPTAHRPELPPELASIISRAMARAPQERYPTAAAIGEDLEKFLAKQGEPTDRAALAEYLKSIFGEERATRKMRVPSLATLSRSGVELPGYTNPGAGTVEPPSDALLPSPKTPTAQTPPVPGRRSNHARHLAIGGGALAVALLGLAITKLAFGPKAAPAPEVAEAVGHTKADAPPSPLPAAVALPQAAPAPPPSEPASVATALPAVRAERPKPARTGTTRKKPQKLAAAPEPAVPPPQPPPASPAGELSDADIQRIIAAGRPEIMKCFQTFKGDLRRAEGKVTVKFTIVRAGSVKGAAVRGELGGTSAGRCIEEQMQSLRFPPGREDVSLETAFSYRLKR